MNQPNLYPNVVYDPVDKLFKLWYKCVLVDQETIQSLDPPSTIHDVGWLLLYATSRDGLKWDKPELGLHSFGGSTDNNAVARDTPNAGVFRDTNPECPEARRFKMISSLNGRVVRLRFLLDGATLFAFHGLQQLPRPVIEPELRHFDESLSVTLVVPNGAAGEVRYPWDRLPACHPPQVVSNGAAGEVRYTLNGEDPTPTSPRYERPLTLDPGNCEHGLFEEHASEHFNGRETGH